MERKKVKADLEEGSSNSADPQIEDVLRLGLATGEGVLPGTSSPNSAGGATTLLRLAFFQPEQKKSRGSNLSIYLLTYMRVVGFGQKT